MEQIPVHCEAYGGFGDLQGLLQFDGTRLRLNYQTSDFLFGVMRSEPRTIEFALHELVRIEYRRGWFWLMPVIEVAVTNFDAIAQLPVKHEGHLRLRLPWSQRRAAQRLVDSLELACSDQRLRRLDDELARMTRPLAADGSASAQPQSQPQSMPPPPPRAARDQEPGSSA